MGVIIVGAEHEPWMVARWAFRGYLEHVLAEVSRDKELTFAIEEALALDGLHLPLLDPAVVRRLMPTLVRVAEEVVRGERQVQANGLILRGSSQDQFRQAVAELREIL